MTVINVQTAHANSPLPEEASLVHRAKSGDSQAFAQLYDAYVERVYRYIYFRISDDDATKQNAQSSVIQSEELGKLKSIKSLLEVYDV